MGMIAEVEGNANLWRSAASRPWPRTRNSPSRSPRRFPRSPGSRPRSRINGGLSGELRAEARDDEAAKNLRRVVQGFLALVKMQAGNKPEMQSMVQSLQLSGTGKSVALSFQVPAEFINAMASKHQKPVE